MPVEIDDIKAKVLYRFKNDLGMVFTGGLNRCLPIKLHALEEAATNRSVKSLLLPKLIRLYHRWNRPICAIAGLISRARPLVSPYH